MSRRFTRGFTLIELLVVIAIIGILASVVLVSLQSARKKGNDTRVISGVQQIRTVLETEFVNNTYPSLTNVPQPTFRFAVKPASGNIATLIDDIVTQQTAGGLSGLYGVAAASGAYQAAPAGTVIIVKTAGNPAKDYAVYAKIPSDSSKAFCLDSSGNSKMTFYPTEAQINAGATSCLP
jgi:prepilin-type N-terminal cleavage/methylation domain-containing protein